MRTFSGEDGAHRLYNANGDLRSGSNDIAGYRPAGGQSVWLYHEDNDSVELRDSDGETLVTFDNPEDVFADPTAHPATDADISDFDEWTAIKRSVIPTVTFGEGGLDREIIDISEVTDDGLQVTEDGGDIRIPIGKLLDHDEGGDGDDGEDRRLLEFSGHRSWTSRCSRWSWDPQVAVFPSQILDDQIWLLVYLRV